MDDIKSLVSIDSPRFLDQVRIFIRSRNYAYSTEKTYIYWILFFIRFNNKQHPKDMGKQEVENFLTFLSNDRSCSKATQRIALNALIFLYRQFFERDLGKLSFNLSDKYRNIPAVFSAQEAKKVINFMEGTTQLMIILMYGSGLRTSEVCSLRIKDIDFDMNQIIVHQAKGKKDRITLLPQAMIPRLKEQILVAKKLHQYDISCGFGEVYLPDALHRKYPNAATETAWQYLFPSNKIATDPRSNNKRRHHLHRSALQRATHAAIKKAGIYKHAKCHTFRHSFATELLLKGYGSFFAPAKTAYITSCKKHKNHSTTDGTF